MSDRLERLEQRLARLEEKLGVLARQLEAPLVPEPTPAAGAADPGPPETAAPWALGADVEDLIARHGLVVLAGLSSLMLAGAIVLRILTLNSPVPLTVGASIGLAYCLALLLIADLMIRRGRLLFGDTFATISMLVLGSLLVEVARLPHGFTREVAYAALTGIFALSSIGAILRRRVVPFTIGLVAAPIAGLAIGGVPFHHPFFASILVIAILAAQFGMSRNGWAAPRLAPGILSLLYLPVLTFLAATATRRDLPQHALASPACATGIFVALFVLYTAFAARVALFRPRRLDGFEITMAVATALLSFVGAASVFAAFPSGTLICGAVGGGAALLFYGVAVLSYVRHGAESGSFHPLSAIAFIYAVASFALVFGIGPRLGFAYQALALALALFAGRYGKRSIAFQSYCLTLAAFGVMLATGFRFAPPAPGGGAGEWAGGWLLATGAFAVAAFAVLRRPGTPSVASTTAPVLVLAAGTVELLAGGLGSLYPVAARALGVEADGTAGGLFLTCQTLLLILGALLVLVATIRFRLGAALALSVGLMSTAGLKLFAFDAFRVPALHLVVSAAVFGIALILFSILYRRHRGLTDADPRAEAPA